MGASVRVVARVVISVRVRFHKTAIAGSDWEAVRNSSLRVKKKSH